MEPCDTAGPKHITCGGIIPYKRLIVGSAVALGLAVAGFWMAGLGRQLGWQAAYAGRAATFSGSSQKLTQTVIVPTLDSPCPPGRNVIWCSSFQLAWNELRDKVIHAPLQVVGAEEVAARLNAAKQSTSDLDAKSFYVAGGWIKDGIVDKIKKDMAAKFSSHVLPDFSDYNDGLLAYSYLTANVPFERPFLQVDEGLDFTDSQGAKTQVAGFGLSEAFRNEYESVRDQVEVLYFRFPDHGQEVRECTVDLCKYSEPYQVVVALVETKGSLAEAFEYVRAQIEKIQKTNDHGSMTRLLGPDVLKVPEMVWRIDHRFLELIGKSVANVGGPVTEAMQTIEFRLDRSGAKVESEAMGGIKGGQKSLIFDRPFLIYMQKRGAEQPFFVMWVDNAELLVRR